MSQYPFTIKTQHNFLQEIGAVTSVEEVTSSTQSTFNLSINLFIHTSDSDRNSTLFVACSSPYDLRFWFVITYPLLETFTPDRTVCLDTLGSYKEQAFVRKLYNEYFIKDFENSQENPNDEEVLVENVKQGFWISSLSTGFLNQVCCLFLNKLTLQSIN